DEHRAFGLGARTPGEKVDGLEDAIRIIRGLWVEAQFTYQGRLYHTDAAEIEPKPDRPIPIWLGTYGPRALALTGRLADGWIPSLGYAPPDRIPGMRERLVRAAEEAGRDPAEITCAYNVELSVPAGSADEVTARLAGFVQLGFSAFNFMLAGPDADEQAERLATEVIPAVRAGVT